MQGDCTPGLSRYDPHIRTFRIQLVQLWDKIDLNSGITPSTPK